jgi:hypothetical protein
VQTDTRRDPKIALLLALALAAALPAAQTRASRTLDAYIVDVEGGNAVLFISPSGESLLIDRPWSQPTAGTASARPTRRFRVAGNFPLR